MAAPGRASQQTDVRLGEQVVHREEDDREERR